MSLTKVSGKLLKDNVNVVAGVVTATTISVGGATTLTQDGISAGVVTATTVDATTIKVGTGVTINSGIISATTIKVGTGVTINSGIISATNVSVGSSVTATNFFGSGANLSGIDATSLKDTGGNVKVQANTSGAVVTGIITVGNSFLKDEAVGLGTTTTTGINSGVGTAVGQMIYNATTGNVQVYKAINGWVNITHVGDDPPEGHTASGGTITNYTDGGKRYRLHEFLTPDSFVVTAVGTIESTVDFLVVGAGGGGGNDTGSGTGGGGGAGGFRTSMPEGPGGPSPSPESAFTVTAATYQVIIGGGGAGNANGNPSYFGPPSTPEGITSQGGGQGGPNTVAGTPGGAGGAGGGPGGAVGLGNRVTGTATPAPPQGWDSGATSGPTGSGGGGAGGAGGDTGAGFVFNDGGVAKRSSISGPTFSIGGPAPPVESPGTGYFAAGGSNSANDMGAGNGVRNSAATGQFGSGGGGGGGGGSGGAGADGVVYIRYEVTPSQ